MLNRCRKVMAFRYTMPGSKNQKLIIRINQRNELVKKAMGVIVLTTYKANETNAKTLTSISIIRISGLLIK